MITGGRFGLGLGVGWLPQEFEYCGVPFERRGKRVFYWLSDARVADVIDTTQALLQDNERKAPAGRRTVAGLV